MLRDAPQILHVLHVLIFFIQHLEGSQWVDLPLSDTGRILLSPFIPVVNIGYWRNLIPSLPFANAHSDLIVICVLCSINSLSCFVA